MTFSESQVSRDTAGRFSETVGSSPEVELDPAARLFEKYEMLHSELAAKHKVMEGRTRNVYVLDDDRVVKVPTDEDGLNAIYVEASWSERYGKDGYIPIAEAKIETWKSADGTELDVLVMERVEEVYLSYKEMPDWVGSVDCAQVGYDRAGRLVAFDL